MKASKICLVPALLGLLAISAPGSVRAETTTNPTYLINTHAKSVTTPVAWGACNNVIFMGVGGTTPAPYSNSTDGAAVLGFGIGDPLKNVGLQASFVSLDISEWDRYSVALHAFKSLGHGNAIGVGVENIMLSEGGDADQSYYVVYSQGFPGESKFHFSVGAGNGRFADKSPADIADGKGKHGTYVFGNVAYEVAKTCNIVADWNGTNLNAGVAKTFWIGKTPIAAVVGAADLTQNSGDGVRLVFAIGTGFKL